jgi:hypothetical protein
VDTEEVDLNHGDDTLMHRDLCWDGSDETDEFVVVCGAHANMPILEVTRGLEGPSEELFGVIKSGRRGGGVMSCGSQREWLRWTYRNMLSSSST